MDSFHDDLPEPSSSSSKHDGKLENVPHLLEEGWFFGELLTRKARMLRCYSDPCPNFDQAMLLEHNSCIQSSSALKRVSSSLTRAPSLPTDFGRREESCQEKKTSSSNGISRLIRQLSDQCFLQEPNNKQTHVEKIERSNQDKESYNRKSKKPLKQKLLRTPSLPPCIGREEMIEENDDIDITMSMLIRQAMPNSTEILPPRNAPKGMVQSYSIPKYRSPSNGKYAGYTNYQRVVKTNQSEVDSQQVHGFKDLGVPFNKQDLDPSEVESLPSFKDKKGKVKWPCRSEAWQVKNCAPPALVWDSKNSAEDVKMQLKCWARSVASNVR